MDKKQFQNGNAHLIIIVILSVALMGTLGFVFWQNFIKAKPNTSQNNDVSKNIGKETGDNKNTQIELSEIAYDHTRGSNLAVKYPKTWNLVHKDAIDTTGEAGPYSSADISTITSPDGKTSVELLVGVVGIGGACDPTDNTVPIVQFEYSEIPNYAGYDYVDYVYRNMNNNTYKYNIGVQANRSSYSTAKVGDSVCNLGLPGYFAVKGVKDLVASLQVSFTDVKNYESTTLTEVNKAKTTTDFETAKRIVQSLYVK